MIQVTHVVDNHNCTKTFYSVPMFPNHVEQHWPTQQDQHSEQAKEGQCPQ